MHQELLHDKSAILTYLKKNTENQIYSIGDLDDFYWPETTWYGLTEDGSLKAIALVYSGNNDPALLAFYDNNPEYSFELLSGIKKNLPDKFFAHLGPGLISVFETKYMIECHGLHYKMVLKSAPPEIVDANIKRLSVNDLRKIEALYSVAYPRNWFDQRMLETDMYFGYILNDNLVGIAGVHVYSKKYNVSALGNIAVHPDFRHKQIGFKLTSRLCNDLIKNVDLIGLNVKSDNNFALKCYRRIGFEIAGSYHECLITKR